MTNFRKLTLEDDIEKVAGWIYSTDTILFNFLFSNESDAKKSIEFLIKSKYVNPYHRKFISVIYDDNPDDFHGIAVAYKGEYISLTESMKAFLSTYSVTLPKLVLVKIFDDIFSSRVKKHDFYLGNLYVDEDYRHKSYGSKLIEKTKQAARQSNSKNLLLDVEYSKKELLKYYEKFGFKLNAKKYHKIYSTTYGCYSMKYKLK